jgi:hypothetical protein
MSFYQKLSKNKPEERITRMIITRNDNKNDDIQKKIISINDNIHKNDNIKNDNIQKCSYPENDNFYK